MRETLAHSLEQVKQAAGKFSATHGRHVFVTLAEQGIIAATPHGSIHHAPAHPVRGPIDIVGAGDAVTANLAAALAAGAPAEESIVLANAAASVVVHQLGTTGTATQEQIHSRLAHAP